MAHKFRGNLRPRSSSAELAVFLGLKKNFRNFISCQQDVFPASFFCDPSTVIILIAGPPSIFARFQFSSYPLCTVFLCSCTDILYIYTHRRKKRQLKSRTSMRSSACFTISINSRNLSYPFIDG